MIDVGLTLDTSALETLRRPIYIVNSSDQAKSRSTTVSLETYPLCSLEKKLPTKCTCLQMSFFIFLQAAFNNLLQECIFLISPLLEDSPAARHHLMMISHRWPIHLSTHTVCQAALIVLTYIVPSVILAGPLCNQSSCHWTQTKFVFKVDATTIHRLAI